MSLQGIFKAIAHYSLTTSFQGNLASLNRQKTSAMLVLLASIALGSVAQAQNLPDVGDIYTTAYDEFISYNGGYADPNTEYANERATAYAIVYATAIREGKNKDAAEAAVYAYFAAKDYDEIYKDAYDKAYSSDLKNSIYATAYATATANAYATGYAKGYATAIKEDPSNTVHARITADDYGTASRYDKADQISLDAEAIANAITTAAAAAATDKNKAAKK